MRKLKRVKGREGAGPGAGLGTSAAWLKGSRAASASSGQWRDATQQLHFD